MKKYIYVKLDSSLYVAFYFIKKPEVSSCRTLFFSKIWHIEYTFEKQFLTILSQIWFKKNRFQYSKESSV